MTTPYRNPEPCEPTMHSFWLDAAPDDVKKMQFEATRRLNAGQVLVFVCKRCKATLPVRDREYARQTANVIARFARGEETGDHGGSISQTMRRVLEEDDR